MGNIRVNLDGIPTEIKRLRIPLKQRIPGGREWLKSCLDENSYELIME